MIKEGLISFIKDAEHLEGIWQLTTKGHFGAYAIKQNGEKNVHFSIIKSAFYI